MDESFKNLRRNLDENELLAEQEAFLKKSKTDPNFKLNVDQISISEQQKQLRAEQQQKATELKADEAKTDGDLNDSLNVFMPLSIVEYDTRNQIKPIRPFHRGSGQVEIQKLDRKWMQESLKSNQSDVPGRRISLFARQQLLKAPQSAEATSSDAIGVLDKQLNDLKVNETIRSSSIVDGSGLSPDDATATAELRRMAQENEKFVAKLSEQERRQALNELGVKPSDVKLLQFLKNRKLKTTDLKAKPEHELSEAANRPKGQDEKRQNGKRVTFNENLEQTMQPEQENDQAGDQVRDLSHLPINPEEAKLQRWLHMDQVEPDKLEWLRPLSNEPKAKKATLKGLSARFKFNGDLIFDEEDVQKGLHHHGDEQERPGYTLNELLSLCQSSFAAQRVLALQTLGNVFERMHRGYFDQCFNESLAQSLIESTDTLIRVRTCLDDSHESVIPAAIKCLHGLVCNTLYDESSLDRIFCSIELGIELPKLDPNPKLTESDLKDDQLSRVDVIRGLLRINLLPRLRYLMDFMLKQKHDRLIVDHILDILIRVARHSIGACERIVQTPHLMDSLVENCIPSHSSAQLNWKALKLIRVLFTSSGKFIEQIMKSHPSLWHVFRTYLLLNPFESHESKDSFQAKNVYAFTVEILRLWRVLLISNRFSDTLERFLEASVQLRSCTRIQILVDNSFDRHYISNLFLCLVHLIKKAPELQQAFTPYIQQIVFTWIQEMKNMQSLPSMDGIAALAAGIHYLNASSLSIQQLHKFVYTPLVESSLFTQITSRLMSRSPVLAFKEMRNSVHRESAALPSFGCIYFGGDHVELNRLLTDENVDMIITPLLNIAIRLNDSSIMQKLLLNSGLRDYVRSIQQSAFTLNWTIFELVEFNTLAQLSLANRILATRISEYFALALKILPSLGDMELRNALFDFVFDTCNFVSLLDLSDDSLVDTSSVRTAISFLHHIKQSYAKLVTYRSHFWLFEPILSLLQQQSQGTPAEQAARDHSTQWQDAANCLNFVYLIWKAQPLYFNALYDDASLWFVLISSVFLLDNGVFLHAELQSILRIFLQHFVDIRVEIKFSEEKLPPPFLNYSTFFDSLCESLQTESYGNALFCNYLLVFLQPTCDAAFRKHLLTDHSSAIKCILLRPDDLALSFDRLVSPPERDLSMIECYLRCLLAAEVDPNRNALLYKLFVHHVSTALFGMEADSNRQTNPAKFDLLRLAVQKTRFDRLKSDLEMGV